jgi:hypothetical protein
MGDVGAITINMSITAVVSGADDQPLAPELTGRLCDPVLSHDQVADQQEIAAGAAIIVST